MFRLGPGSGLGPGLGKRLCLAELAYAAALGPRDRPGVGPTHWFSRLSGRFAFRDHRSGGLLGRLVPVKWPRDRLVSAKLGVKTSPGDGTCGTGGQGGGGVNDVCLVDMREAEVCA